ncbi:MAG: alkaline phosphatase family protein, partial [Chitinophagaceae bacterium]|nr:alkaline phosphatase family protein [Chitinophagaceae bacterium]
MIRLSFLLVAIILNFMTGYAQTVQTIKPKLVVGIVVDQMRWDFLYRYHDRYKNDGGFKRLLEQGFNFENTLIPYTPTVTACGHATLYTGTTPAIHGITGNGWWDKNMNRSVYCTEDDSVQTVGSPESESGQQSPRNLLTTTICDELRLATNFRSKVIGVAIKDRGGILAAGHSANASYWYNSADGNFISSTYYMKQLPDWVIKFNKRKLVDQYYQLNWELLHPSSSYVQSTGDQKNYEAKPLGADQKGFPYDLKRFTGKSFGALASTPHGNTLTIEMAKAAIEGEQLGADNITDFLAVSFSSPDYIGHAFGPNSIETEDMYLRFDNDLGDFLNYLDQKIGKGHYLLFLSADHGVAHIPGFSIENKLPGGQFFGAQVFKNLNELLKTTFKQEDLVTSLYNYQVHFDHAKIREFGLDQDALAREVVRYMEILPEVSHVFAINKMANTALPEKLKEMVANGYHPTRNGDVHYLLKPGYIDAYGSTGTTHGTWNPYDSHIPLIFYGWNIKPGKSYREVYMNDVAPTLAALLQIQTPNGTTG